MTSQNEMTPWFSVDTPPSRPGVYNISCRDYDQTGIWYSYWDGEFWRGRWVNSGWKTIGDAVEKTYENKDSDFCWKSGEHWGENWTWGGITFESWCGR